MEGSPAYFFQSCQGRRRHTCHGVRTLNNEFNFVIDNGQLRGLEGKDAFGDELFQILPAGTDFWDILVQLGVFSSKSQAKRDPRWGTMQVIPEGITDIKRIGKLRLRFTIFKPCIVDWNQLDQWDLEGR